MSVKIVAIVGLLLFVARSVGASSITVPIGGSIQQALDASVDTVFVRDGAFRERLRITRSVVLFAYRSTGFFTTDACPVVDAISIAPDYLKTPTSQVVVSGFTVTGPIELDISDARWGMTTVEACRIDSGIVQPSDVSLSEVHRVRVRSCTVRGNVSLIAYYVDFQRNTVIGGETVIRSEGEHSIQSNVFLDSPGTALLMHSSSGSVEVADNRVDGAVVGMEFRTTAHALRNVVENCSQVGLAGSGHFESNTIRACGVGIHARGDRAVAMVRGNTVLACASDGVLLGDDTRDGYIVGNRVGRCGGHGIVAPNATVQGNTAFRNEGSGIVGGIGAAPISRNVAFENGGFGLEAPANVQGSISCNDWFGNMAGATLGVVPSVTDLAVDPLFCDVDGDDVQLRPESPLVDVAECGRIGADSVGCGGVTETRDTGNPERPGSGVDLALELVAIPHPATRGAQVSYTLPKAAGIRLILFDLQGREVAELARGTREAGWHEVRLPSVSPGTYFVTLDAGARRLARKVVVVR